MLEERRLAAIGKVGKLQETEDYTAEKPKAADSTKTKFALKIEESDKEIKEGDIGKVEFTAE